MKEKPIVSVIVPVYNSTNTIEKCLYSLISQTLKNIEIIVIDDGSNDDSLELCRKCAEKDQRIRVITQSNHGISYTRNIGISISSGEYILFLDSDDYVDNTFCENAVNNALKYKSDVVLLSYNRVKDGNVKSVRLFGMNDKLIDKALIMKNILHNSYVCFYLYRRSLYNGISYPSNRNFEDLFTTYKIIQKAGSCSYCSECDYYYIDTENSLGSDMSQKNIADQFDAAWELMKFLKKNYPKEYKYNIAGLLEYAIRYCTYCSKNFNLDYYNRAYNLLKKSPIPSELDFQHQIVMKLFKISAPLTNILLLIRRKTNQ